MCFIFIRGSFYFFNANIFVFRNFKSISCPTKNGKPIFYYFFNELRFGLYYLSKDKKIMIFGWKIWRYLLICRIVISLCLVVLRTFAQVLGPCRQAKCTKGEIANHVFKKTKTLSYKRSAIKTKTKIKQKLKTHLNYEPHSNMKTHFVKSASKNQTKELKPGKR